MTRKDYKLIAEVISTSWFGSADLKLSFASNLADELAQDNPRFNRSIFLTACGVK
jgi:hypothetical protein